MCFNIIILFSAESILNCGNGQTENVSLFKDSQVWIQIVLFFLEQFSSFII